VSTPFLKTKLYIPPVRPELVSRPHLVERLDEGFRRGCKLVIISAPAGYGKTTLLGEWIAHCELRTRVAWVSLDEGDNDPVRFWTYVVATLQTVREDIGEIAQTAFQSPHPLPIESALTGLLNQIAKVPDPVVLVLDDYHVISVSAIHDALSFLLENLPPQMHLVIATRADPPLPIPRLRGRGQLTELYQSDLRFTSKEIAEFLNQVLGLGLSVEDVAALEKRTEGWIAGLQMAAISMRGRDDIAGFVRAFTGSHRYILDYLSEEVLRQQSRDVRMFLLQTAILDRLSGELCDAVIGASGPAEDRSIVDSQSVLEYLERSNLFVVPLDDERRWYRYHRLFSDVMRNRLQRMYPDQLSDLHLRAAEWFEKNHFIGEALHHALAAEEQDRAARLVEQNAMAMLMRGELATLLGWIESIESLAHERPWLSIYQSWVLTLTGQLDQVDPWLQEAEHLVSQHDVVSEARDMLGHVAAIRAYQAAQRGEASRAIDFADQALKHLSDSNKAVRSVVTLTLGIARRLSGDLAGASHAMEEAVRTGQAAGNIYLALGALSGLADLLFDQGKLHQAFSTYGEMVQWATRPDGRRFPAAGMAFFGLGTICYERNDLEAALRHIRQSIELCRQWGNVGILMAGYVLLFRVRQVQGDVESARGALSEAERLARANPLAPRAVSWVESFRARSWLAQGDIEAAVRWAEQRGIKIDDDFSYLRDAEYLTLGRVFLAQREYDMALMLFERLRNSAETIGRIGSLIEILVLQAITLQAKSDISRALAILEQALSLAEPEGYVRTFVDEGEPMARLLRRALSQGIAPNYVARLLAAFGEEVESTFPAMESLIEPLSERELEVLRLIVAGLSNPEIAQELVIAVSTVKSHVNHIYGKLGVESRTQAVARAQELGLL
jgi:LuxR family maltose regulon positive regulatory protein